MLSFALLLCLVAGIEGLWQKPPAYDPQCTIDERAFTGVRILHEHTLYLPSFVTAEKQTVVLECELGRELYRVNQPSNVTVFDRDIEVPNKQLRLVRQPAYTSSTKMRYVPGTVVGAAYQSYDGGAHWDPVSPLIADYWDNVGHETVVSLAETTVYVSTSLLRSPDVLEKTFPRDSAWVSKIPLNRTQSLLA